MNFTEFKTAIQHQFKEMTSNNAPLFEVDVSIEDMWATYLGTFENDPIYRTKHGHDCSCCRHFIRNIGNVVTIDETTGDILSIWDHLGHNIDYEYKCVAEKMAELIRSRSIRDVFVTDSNKLGVDRNRAMIDGAVTTFEHFYLDIPKHYVKPKVHLDTYRGHCRTSCDMFKRMLTEIKLSAVDEVLELIASNSLYRGEESAPTLRALRTLLVSFPKQTALSLNQYTWIHHSHALARVRNTAIGTLLVDLSEGMDIEQAVKSFEKKVAPENYKRPTALVTPRMIEDARKAVEGLGLMDAIHRRYATLADVSVNNVLYADRTAKHQMKGADAFADLAASQPINVKAFDRVDTIDIEKFITDVLPTAASLEILFENKHVSSLVSLVTEAVPNSPRMFKWDNPFSWSYKGDVTDSIKERVKAAGGNVTGEVCCRLAWNNTDDLDFHMTGPGGHIYYITRTDYCGGRLDIDANGQNGMMVNPVENIYYARRSTMKDGEYSLQVHQYNNRSMKDVGYTVEIDVLGDVITFESPTNPVQGKTVDIATLTVKHGQVTVTPIMKSTSTSRTEWGIATSQFQRVNAVMFSPNHWDGQGVGNRHYFFLLADCVNADNARGFYNEFLLNELDPHRKVLEMIGSRQRTDETPNQLSGLGFSSTKKQTFIVRVTGSLSRVLKVTI